MFNGFDKSQVDIEILIELDQELEVKKGKNQQITFSIVF